MRRRSNNPDGLRRRIVDSAFVLFAREGYGATAVHDVKAHAGVTGGALAHHFPSKKALGLAVLSDPVAEAVLQAWIKPVEEAPDAASGILAAFDRVIEDLEARRISGCPLNNLALELAGHDEDLRQAADALFERWRDAVAAKLRHDAAAGQSAATDTEALAALAVAAISGAMAMAKAAQSVEPLRRCRDGLAGFLAGASIVP